MSEEKMTRNDVTMRIVDYLKDNGVLWVSNDGEYYMTVPSGEDLLMGKSGTPFDRWLITHCMDTYKFMPAPQWRETLVQYFIGKGQSAERKQVNIRIGGDEDHIILDGLDFFITVNKDGWNYDTPAANMKFIRGTGMKPFPQPQKGVSPSRFTSILRKYVNCSEKDFSLICAWIIGCFKPNGPYPVLIVNGEQGSGKSTVVRLLRRIVDPHERDMREPFEDRKDIPPALRNAYVLAFDNVSMLRHWLSDTLCRIATGTGAIGGRTLYTNMEETAFTACRPIVLNGIPDFAERGDLIDRAIQVSLPTIPPEKRRDDDSYWAEFDADWPELFGALLEIIRRTIADFPTTHLKSAPRMSNFARWATASEPHLGFNDGTIMSAYINNRQAAEATLLEFNSLGSMILRFMEGQEAWTGTYGELTTRLLGAKAPLETLPASSQGLAAELRRITPALQRAGIKVYNTTRRSTKKGQKGRTIVEIYRTPHAQDSLGGNSGEGGSGEVLSEETTN